MNGAEVGMSFMRPTKYASAASCKHIIVLHLEVQIILAHFKGYLTD